MLQRQESLTVMPAQLLRGRGLVALPAQILSSEIGDPFRQTGKPLIAPTVRKTVEEQLARKVVSSRVGQRSNGQGAWQ